MSNGADAANEPTPYGHLDATFRAAGGERGIRQLVDCFYDLMASDPAYRTIWRWHPDDNEQSRDKLARFLCGWMGGPRRYQERYGSISIPRVHAHLHVTESERDQWLACMTRALEAQDYPAGLQSYLIEQLSIPADVIRRTSAATNSADGGTG